MRCILITQVCTEKPQQPDAALIEHNQRAQIEAEIEAKIKEIWGAEAEELMVDQIVVSVPTEELPSQRSSSEVMVGLNEEFAEQVREVTPIVTVTPRSQGMTVCPQDDKPQVIDIIIIINLFIGEMSESESGSIDKRMFALLLISMSIVNILLAIRPGEGVIE